MSEVSVITLTDVEPVRLAGGSWSRVLVADSTVAGNVSALGYSVFKPGTSTADLSHETEELAYIVSGRGVIRLETEDVPVAAGQALYVPAKIWHTVLNPGAGRPGHGVLVPRTPITRRPNGVSRAVSYQAGRPPPTSEDAIRQVKLACRILARHGQEDLTLGHASVRGPDGGTIWIKRKGRALRDVRKKDVIGIALDDPDGHLTPGAHLETIMHLETYRARPDVGAVIHTHPLYSIALGATAGGLELLSHDGLLFPDGVPVFDGTAGLVTTPRDGQGVARALGGGRAVLLRNHGILAAGPDISWAVLTALTLDRAARIQFIARTLGETVPIPREIAHELSVGKYREEFAEEYWQDWCAMLDNPA